MDTFSFVPDFLPFRTSNIYNNTFYFIYPCSVNFELLHKIWSLTGSSSNNHPMLHYNLWDSSSIALKCAILFKGQIWHFGKVSRRMILCLVQQKSWNRKKYLVSPKVTKFASSYTKKPPSLVVKNSSLDQTDLVTLCSKFKLCLQSAIIEHKQLSSLEVREVLVQMLSQFLLHAQIICHNSFLPRNQICVDSKFCLYPYETFVVDMQNNSEQG